MNVNWVGDICVPLSLPTPFWWLNWNKRVLSVAVVSRSELAVSKRYPTPHPALLLPRTCLSCMHLVASRQAPDTSWSGSFSSGWPSNFKLYFKIAPITTPWAFTEFFTGVSEFQGKVCAAESGLVSYPDSAHFPKVQIIIVQNYLFKIWQSVRLIFHALSSMLSPMTMWLLPAALR